MLSPGERQHLALIKEWVEAQRQQDKLLKQVFALVFRSMSGAERIYHDLIGNVDWLIKIAERESKRTSPQSSLSRRWKQAFIVHFLDQRILIHSSKPASLHDVAIIRELDLVKEKIKGA